MRKDLLRFVLCALTLLTATSCHQNTAEHKVTGPNGATNIFKTTSDPSEKKAANTAEIMARKEVPILCYHQIRNWTAKDSKRAKDDICPVDRFKAHMKMLADNGYHTILPDDLLAYLTQGKVLPTNPVMITFDDTDLDQFTVGYPELKKYHFKAVFFIMTVALGHKRYMTKDQVKQLSAEGHVIGSHTYDHKMVVKYKHNTDPKLDDWTVQVDEPTRTLEKLTGKKVGYFAYPYGLWNMSVLPELKKHGFKAAFQLAEKRDANDPLFTIRRIIGSGYWSASGLHHAMLKSFK